ncbi:hypothetical protein [Parasitella parasitica]|uniref:Uncharacterized protein n=1 Tax=Parasitella parasitica TaxID=35722 RepID=A0A0B7NIZ7_9FUNG|nr:hypothetical protein [Parasitella parasitica]
MFCLPLTWLLFIPALLATPFNNQHLQRRDLTTVYQPTTIYETVIASSIEGIFRKTKKVYKHRHEVVKQDRQEFEDQIEQLNQQLDPYREFIPGQAAKYRQEKEEEEEKVPAQHDYHKGSYDDFDDDGHCEQDDPWCCEEGEEGCDEYEYEECNEGEEGCEEYDEDENLIIRELDFDVYIEDIEELVGTTIKDLGVVANTLLKESTIINNDNSKTL